MSTFTFAISCLTTSNSCLDSWTWHSRFLCNIALYSIGPCFYHQSHPQPGIIFALPPSLHSSGVISPLISSSILGTYWPGEFLFQYPIILPFHTVHGVLKARILKWFAIPFSSGPHSFRSLHHDPPILGCLTGMAYVYINDAMYVSDAINICVCIIVVISSLAECHAILQRKWTVPKSLFVLWLPVLWS